MQGLVAFELQASEALREVQESVLAETPQGVLMLAERNLQVCHGAGRECFVCEQACDDVAIQVSFDVSVVLSTINVKKVMHVGCAGKLESMLKSRIKQAGG